MPDETGAPAAPTPPASAPNPDVKLPEKFAGKSAEDIYRSYAELERKYGETSGKLKDLDEYGKIGSAQQINEALTWARQMKAALDQGLIVPKGQQPKQPAESKPATRPWEDESWAFKSPKDQFNDMYEEGKRELSAYAQQMQGEYEKRLNALTQQDARQKQILMKALKSAIKNPEVDPEQMLTEVAQLATKTPEEMIDMYLEARTNSPEAMQKKVDEMVAAKLAERIQEHEAKQLADITSMSTPKPRGLSAKVPANGFQAREAENRSILESLRKDGISLL